MTEIDSFSNMHRNAVDLIDIDEEFSVAVRPLWRRSQAELDVITQEITHALKLERIVAKQVTTPAELPPASEIDTLLIEQPSST